MGGHKRGFTPRGTSLGSFLVLGDIGRALSDDYGRGGGSGFNQILVFCSRAAAVSLASETLSRLQKGLGPFRRNNPL